jgi:Cys-tRNA(Pro)/Cys-tRNA(Cys) deacylase
MAKPPARTNAMRLLDREGVAYTVHAFSDAIRSATDVAAAVGVPESQVFKTLVTLTDENAPVLVMIPSHAELDLKALARAAGAKRCQMASHRDAEKLTGLQVGGISPLALTHRGWRVFIDMSALARESVLVSAGKRGINLELAVADLMRITAATPADVIRGQG